MTENAVAAGLDAFDRAILALLQRDATLPLRAIGAAVNLSAAAVQRRIQRLRRDGVIAAEVAVLDPGKAGRPLTLFVEVVLISETAVEIDAAKRLFASEPAVQQCYYVTGEADFVLVVTVATMGEYEALTRRLFFEGGNMRKFRSFVAMDRVKAGLALPLG